MCFYFHISVHGVLASYIIRPHSQTEHLGNAQFLNIAADCYNVTETPRFHP